MDQAAALYARAAAERAAAAECKLENRRAMHERSAEAWRAMAIQIEETAAKAIVNEAAKQAAVAG